MIINFACGELGGKYRNMNLVWANKLILEHKNT